MGIVQTEEDPASIDQWDTVTFLHIERCFSLGLHYFWQISSFASFVQEKEPVWTHTQTHTHTNAQTHSHCSFPLLSSGFFTVSCFPPPQRPGVLIFQQAICASRTKNNNNTQTHIVELLQRVCIIDLQMKNKQQADTWR